MATTRRPFFSPQTGLVYRSLLKLRKATVREIAQKIGVFPNAIYRSLELLERCGCVKEIHGYPHQYAVCPVNEAADNIAFHVREGFLKSYRSDKKSRQLDEMSIEFIQHRNALFEKNLVDLRAAKHEVLLIISGHEVPADIFYENQKAVKRGVSMKAIVQTFDSKIKTMLLNWKRIGMEIRYLPHLDVRIILLDRKIVYIMSFNPETKKSDMGVRIAYKPLANLMYQIFTDKWKKAADVQ